MSDVPNSETRFYRIATVVLSTLMLGLLSYFAWTVQNSSTLLQVMAEHVTSIDQKIDQGFGWQSKRIDDHEIRLRALEQKK